VDENSSALDATITMQKQTVAAIAPKVAHRIKARCGPLFLEINEELCRDSILSLRISLAVHSVTNNNFI
jgi:hypothetical protein